MSTMRDELRNRFEAAGYPGLRDTFETAIGLIDIPGTRAATLKEKGTLTPAGVAEEVRSFTATKVAPKLRQIRNDIADNRKHLAEYRQKLSRPPVDPSDTIGMEHRKEARSILRGMSNAQRIGTLVGDKADPLFVAAALEVPNAMSGLNDDTRSKIEQAYAERTNGPKLAEISKREDALTIIDQVAKIASSELQKHVGIPYYEFDNWINQAGRATFKEPM